MNIIIIGGVAAGMSAAAKIRRLKRDWTIRVYEKTGYPSLGACGLPYFIGGFTNDPEVLIARTLSKIIEDGIDMRTGHEVTGIDPSNKQVTVKHIDTGETFTDHYDKLLIASGVSPVIPPFENASLENIHTVKSYDDGIILKSKLSSSNIKETVIIGAGFIGLEMAEALKHRGKNVRVIQLDKRVLPDTFDGEISEIIEKELVSQNIALHTGERVLGFSGSCGVEKVITDKGTYPADLVIIAAGVKPNTAFLGNTGLELLSNGAVKTDNQCRTNIEDIYAAGDCAAVYHMTAGTHMNIPLGGLANKAGRTAGDVICGGSAKLDIVLGSAAVKVLDIEAGRTGITEQEALKYQIPCKSVYISDKDHPASFPGQENIHVKLVYSVPDGRFLGGQVAGKQGAVLRTDVLAAAIAGGLTVRQLGILDLCYSPPFSKPWDALNIAGYVAD